jgi:integrase
MQEQTISPLRRRMIEDMTVREFTTGTQRGYITAVRNFTVFPGRPPDRSDVKDLRRYQLHMRSEGASATLMNAAVSALHFFFGVTLGRNDVNAAMTTVREPKKLPVILSPDEVTRLLDAAPGLKYRAALGIAYGTGPRASEVVSLKVSDIDSERIMIRVEQGPLRQVVGAPARSPARPVAGDPRAVRDAAGRLAVPGPEPGQPADHPPAQPRLPFWPMPNGWQWRQGGGRHRQVGEFAQ